MTNLGFGFIPIHPGEVLRDELKSRHITQRQFADRLGLKYSVVNEILKGRRPVSTRTALMVEAALGIPADSLLQLQLKYDLQVAKADKSLSERLGYIKQFPSPAIA